jgi:diguanylate cyclase (GGDEF)-like protein
MPLSRRFAHRYIFAIAGFGVLALLTLVSVERTLDEAETATSAHRTATSLAATIDSNRLLLNDYQDAGTPEVREEIGGLSRQTLVPLEAQLTALERSGGHQAQIAEIRSLVEEFRAQALEYLDRYVTPEEAEDNTALNTAENFPRLDAAEATGAEALAALRGRGTSGSGVGLIGLYAAQIDEVVDDQSALNLQLGLVWVIAASCIVLFVFQPMSRSIRLETTQLEEAERMQRENNERQTFRNDLKQALENTENEDEIFDTVGRSLGQVVPDEKAELLLVDASKAHLRSVLEHPTMGSPQCPVDTPGGCAAVRRGQPLIFESSRMLNVCPKLPQHDGPCSAVCVPLVFIGESLGVLHLMGPDGTPPNELATERLKVVAAEAGNRLGTMRAMQATQLQADTDGLTGLLNRRSLETRARELIGESRQFSVAIGDLDHFKQMNDTYGHETGDRALRLFAKTLRSNLRPGDIAARFGGEEFVIILPGVNIRAAQRALERLQLSLAADIGQNSTVPPFTASWGLTDTSAGESFSDVLAVADAALYDAKRNGRNCIVVDGEALASLRTRRDPEDDGPHPDEDDELRADVAETSRTATGAVDVDLTELS